MCFGVDHTGKDVVTASVDRPGGGRYQLLRSEDRHLAVLDPHRYAVPPFPQYNRSVDYREIEGFSCHVSQTPSLCLVSNRNSSP